MAVTNSAAQPRPTKADWDQLWAFDFEMNARCVEICRVACGERIRGYVAIGRKKTLPAPRRSRRKWDALQRFTEVREQIRSLWNESGEFVCRMSWFIEPLNHDGNQYANPTARTMHGAFILFASSIALCPDDRLAWLRRHLAAVRVPSREQSVLDAERVAAIGRLSRSSEADKIMATLRPPLSDREAEVFRLIHDSGSLIGKEVSDRLGIGQSTLTAHIIPALKKRKLVGNRRGTGYFSLRN